MKKIIVYDISREEALEYYNKSNVTGEVFLESVGKTVNVAEYLVDHVSGCRYRSLRDTVEALVGRKSDIANAISGCVSVLFCLLLFVSVFVGEVEFFALCPVHMEPMSSTTVQTSTPMF